MTTSSDGFQPSGCGPATSTWSSSPTSTSTPGHTRGHQSLLVRLDGQTVFLLADAAYLLAKMRSRKLPGILWSPDATIASWDRIEEIERSENAHLMTTHELDFETSVRLAPMSWYE